MSSCSGGSKRSSRRLQRMFNDEEEEELNDPGSWECSVCTYRNTADTFHCEMCDTRKGTSTRKPKLNSTVFELQQTVQKIVQQQAAILSTTVDPVSSKERPGREKSACSLIRSKGAGQQSPSSSVNNGGTWSSADSPGVSSPAPSSTQASTPQPTSPSTSRNASNTVSLEPTSTESKQFVVDHQLLTLDVNSARTLAVTADDVTVIITDYSLTPVGSPLKRKKVKRQRVIKVESDDSDSNLGGTASASSSNL
ncbi:hypothetical protein M514_10403 [Trichuris suis]|uniref:RanBP2-type domain-containing protein n=1 Tax=Trichuris suis TaxID=68888 RepID=A0A085LUP6_9BILA|nr:hypothetical protein M513_10403 [Trichuris suis]KFD69282.1 hypothetical protein M514_10403 [Trichuris suis]